LLNHNQSWFAHNDSIFRRLKAPNKRNNVSLSVSIKYSMRASYTVREPQSCMHDMLHKGE